MRLYVEEMKDVVTAATRLSKIADSMEHIVLYGRIEVRSGDNDAVLGHLVPREDATFHFEPVTR